MADENHDGPEAAQPLRPYQPRRRGGPGPARGSRPGGAKGKRPVKLLLPEATYEAMVIHALRRGETLSELVEGLVTRGCNEWIVHGKPGRKSDVG